MTGEPHVLGFVRRRGDTLRSASKRGVEVEFDPEFAGDDDAVRIQKRIFEQAHGIAATNGLVSRGSRVGLLDAWCQSPVGCAIAMDESSAGPDFVGWYFGGNVGVAPDWKGRGLGRWLNARAVQIARSVGSATFVHELVSAANIVSQRMIASCGLTQDVEIAALVATTMAIPEAWH